MTTTAATTGTTSTGGTAEPSAGSGRRGVPPAALALGAMLCVQVGVAGSTPLFDSIGTAGTAWLRLTWAGLILLAVARPAVRSIPRGALGPAVLLGLISGAMTLAFLAAVDRLPLGTAAAIEFLGPLGVAVVRSARARDLWWPVLAGLGIVSLTEPWTGTTDVLGVAYALIAAGCWAAYILLTQRVGDQLHGIQGLAISMPVAALAAAFIGIPQAWGDLTLGIVLLGGALAVVLPVVPYALEMQALRRLTTAAFGTLMSLEPAIALLIGLVLLHQVPAPWQLLGVTLVVAAGIGAERNGRRETATAP